MTGKYLTPFQRKLLQKNLDNSADIPERLRKRLEIMLHADDGKSQAEICKLLNCSAATARTWILKAQSGLAHQWQENPLGRPKVVNGEHIDRLKQLINTNPRELGERFDEWTGYSLSRRLSKEFGIKVTKHHINRLLKQEAIQKRGNNSAMQMNHRFNRGHKPRILIYNLPRDRTLEFVSGD